MKTFIVDRFNGSKIMCTILIYTKYIRVRISKKHELKNIFRRDATRKIKNKRNYNGMID